MMNMDRSILLRCPWMPKTGAQEREMELESISAETTIMEGAKKRQGGPAGGKEEQVSSSALKNTLKNTFYFAVILNLHRSCKDCTETACEPFTRHPSHV